jgi:chromosomal replication initiator protein
MLSDRDFLGNKILAAVAKHFDVTTAELRGRRRFRRIAVPRHTVAWIMRQAGFTLADIGREINRDHTTAYYGVQVIAKMRADDPEGFGAEVGKLADELVIDFADQAGLEVTRV